MMSANNGNARTSSGRNGSQTGWRTAAIMAAVVVLAVIVIAALGFKSAEAHLGELDSTAEQARQAERGPPMLASEHVNLWAVYLGNNPLGALWPASAINVEHGVSQTHASEDSAGAVYAWAARLTVGQTSNGTATALGFMPSAIEGDGLGNLVPATFTYADVDYTVETLFLRQQKISGVRHLVFQADSRLPDNLILHAGGHRFLVNESMVMGLGSNIHVWNVDGEMSWTDGQNTYVALLEPSSGEHEPSPMLPSALSDRVDAENPIPATRP